ncbi:hypothetical protein AAMO2058_001695000 [Amorphochlora amoebiformis]
MANRKGKKDTLFSFRDALRGLSPEKSRRRHFTEAENKGIRYYGRELIRSCQNRLLFKDDLVIVLAEMMDDEVYLAKVDHYSQGRKQCKITRHYPYKMSRWVPIKRLQAIGRGSNQKGQASESFSKAVGEIDRMLKSFEELFKDVPIEKVLNFQDWDLTTPLHVAAMSRAYEIVRYLIRRGADPLMCDIIGQTPLHSATTVSGNVDVIRELLEGVWWRDTKLHRAETPGGRGSLGVEKANQGESLKKLLRKKDSIGRTALMNACMAVNTDSLVPLCRLQSQNFINLSIDLWIGRSWSYFTVLEEQDVYSLTPKNLLSRLAKIDERMADSEIVFDRPCSLCRASPICGSCFSTTDGARQYCGHHYTAQEIFQKNLQRVRQSQGRRRMRMGVLLLISVPPAKAPLQMKNCLRLQASSKLQAAGVHRNARLIIGLNSELDAREKNFPLPELPARWKDRLHTLEKSPPLPSPSSPPTKADSPQYTFVTNNILPAVRRHSLSASSKKKDKKLRSTRDAKREALRPANLVISPQASDTKYGAGSPTKFDQAEARVVRGQSSPGSPSFVETRPPGIGRKISTNRYMLSGMQTSSIVADDTSGQLSESNAVIKLLVDSGKRVNPAKAMVFIEDQAGMSAYDYAQSNSYLSILLEAEVEAKKVQKENVRNIKRREMFSPTAKRYLQHLSARLDQDDSDGDPNHPKPQARSAKSAPSREGTFAKSLKDTFGFGRTSTSGKEAKVRRIHRNTRSKSPDRNPEQIPLRPLRKIANLDEKRVASRRIQRVSRETKGSHPRTFTAGKTDSEAPDTHYHAAGPLSNTMGSVLDSEGNQFKSDGPLLNVD